MSDWILVPCLVALRNEFNAIAPDRDRRSDGSVGDAAHAASSSDHNPDETGTVPIHDADSTNEVHAIDVDSSGPWPEMAGKPGSMERVVQHLLARCRAGLEDRLRYIIYDHRIWSASSGWVQKAYTGSSPHTEHAHFSASYGSAQESDTHSWHLEDLVALTDADLDQIEERLLKVTKQTGTDFNTNPVGRAVLDFQAIPNPLRGGKTSLWELLRDIASAVKVAAEEQGVSSETLLAAVGQVDEQVLAALPGQTDDETAATIVALLGPERAAAVAGRILAG